MEETVREGRISVATLVIRLIIDFFAMMILVGFYWIVRDIIDFCTTKLSITTKRVTGKRGLINTNQLDSPLNKINGVQVEQGLFGKMFNYGNISITTASTVFIFRYIDKPNEFRATLNNQIEAYDDARIEQQAQKLAEAVKNK